MPESLNPATAITGLQEFLETGGNVLVVIMVITFIMWAFILERLAYWRFAHARVEKEKIASWKAWLGGKPLSTDDRWRWYQGHAIRDQLISEARQSAEQNVELVKTLVAIAPMLGLLGTVTGMVEVFDVMAISGSSNARAMSAGVSKATIPTMAGMVSALSGLFLSNYIERMAKNKVQQLGDHLEIE
jgi:biopolymer transport protein ExbB